VEVFLTPARTSDRDVISNPRVAQVNLLLSQLHSINDVFLSASNNTIKR
jgi:hypothetical protein